MKIIFSFLLTTFSLHCIATDIIYDSAGNKLQKNVPYFILPLLRGTGGGLTVSQTTRRACPFNVTQEPYEVNYGIPFTFNPIVLEEEFVRGAYPTSIKAHVSNPCHDSTIWMVLNSEEEDIDYDDDRLTDSNDRKKKDDDKPLRIVTTGGEFNKPESCFQIVENVMMPGLLSYQIQYCPFKCRSTSSVFMCYNIGLVSDDDGKRYVAPTDALFPVVFTKSSFGTYSRSAETSTLKQLSAKVDTVNQLLIRCPRISLRKLVSKI